MSGTPSLQKIKGRFTVPVQLSDTDVEAVIRKIILQKSQRAIPAIRQTLTDNLGELFSQRATLIQHSQDWQATGEQISQRWPNWTQLQTLLSHAKDLAPYQALAAEAEQIQQQRALLAEHDPVQALLDKTVDLLRGSLNQQRDAYQSSYQTELAALEQDSHWLALDPEQRQAMLASHNLNGGLALDLSSPDSILDELERCSLAQWPNGPTAHPGPERPLRAGPHGRRPAIGAQVAARRPPAPRPHRRGRAGRLGRRSRNAYPRQARGWAGDDLTGAEPHR